MNLFLQFGSFFSHLFNLNVLILNKKNLFLFLLTTINLNLIIKLIYFFDFVCFVSKVLQISLLGHRRRMLASIDSDLSKQKQDENKRHSSNVNNGIRVSSISSAPFSTQSSHNNNHSASSQNKQSNATVSHTNSLENLKNSLSASSFYSSPMKSVKFADEQQKQQQQQQQEKEQENQKETEQETILIDKQLAG